MKRKHISLKTKLAAALKWIGEIPHDDAKQMTEDQIISLFHWDHNQLFIHGGPDKFWNLTPILILSHRKKTAKDKAIIAKTNRLHKRYVSRETPKPKRKIFSRPFAKQKSRLGGRNEKNRHA